MPQLTPVSTLYNLTVQRLWKLIHDLFDEHMKTCDSNHRKFDGTLCPTLTELRRILLTDIGYDNCTTIMSYSLQEQSDCSSLIHIFIVPLLITKNTETISYLKIAYNALGYLRPQTNSEIILLTIACNGLSNIVELRVRKFLKDLVLFEQALSNMPLLTVFEFNYGYDCDDYLAIVGRKCPKLYELNVAKSGVTVNGFQKLCFADFPENMVRNQICDSLRLFYFRPWTMSECELKSTHLKAEDVLVLLQNLPNLQSMLNFNQLAAAISLAVQKNIPFSRKLTRVVQKDMTENMIQDLHENCQDLKVLALDTPHENVFTKLNVLNNVKVFCSFRGLFRDVELYLQNHGERLEVLHMYKMQASCDIARTAELCPNLKEFYYHTRRTYYTSDIFSFNKLTKLHWNVTSDQHQNFINLLSKLPSIEDIWIKCSDQFTDGDIFKLIGLNQFSHLKRLYLDESAQLTMKSMTALVEHCPVLKSLGNFYCIKTEYGTLSRVDFQQYCRELEMRNLDINLVFSEVSYFESTEFYA